ncbi:MAG TPA: ABC transporter ATP-binding protein [Acidimicrobiia bacterium]|nr:transporter related [Acidimicrobiia bacterium]HYJ25794.1 ABC transporter ATP-binding protein [Acidimicrobiia bacterium]
MPLLELEEVGKHFGGLPAVDGVNVGVDDGEVLAIVGPNGAGKSTLLKLIVGLERPTSGTITFDGRRISGHPTHTVSRLGIAMVQQTPRVFPNMSVLENATLGAIFGSDAGGRTESEALAMGREILTIVGLGDRHGDQVANLNLHERRFLELARALAGQPRLILLDEVMAGLNDAELSASIEMVRTIRERFGITVVWVEHVMKAVMQLAERVVVLNFGRVLAEGPAETVMRDNSVVEAYLGAGDVNNA